MNTSDPHTGDDGAFIDRLVAACVADDRIVAALLGGSRARGQADEFSDIDISVIIGDEAYSEIVGNKDSFARGFGEPLFVEDFGIKDVILVVFGDGTELDLFLVRLGDLDSIRSGPHEVLLDKTGVLEGRTFPFPEAAVEALTRELRDLIFWFWHDVGHLVTALGRGQLWWAAGQLEILRHCCVKLIRIEQSAEVTDEPYWKLDTEISTEPLNSLRSTFVRLDRVEMLDAGRRLVAFFRERAPGVARAHGLAYPEELDSLITGHLDALDG